MTSTPGVSTPIDDGDGEVARPGVDLVGRHVYLRPYTPDDLGLLHEVASHPSSGAMWRWQGAPRGPDPLASTFPSIFNAFVVADLVSDEPMSIAVSAGADLFSRTCTVSVARPDYHGSGLHLEGATLFVSYLFRTWQFRKLYGEVLEYNLPRFRRAFAWPGIVEEGRLRDHVFLDGRYQDLIYLAIYRDEWMAGTASLLRRLAPGPNG